jgi:glyceraldehyde 3-phosphate dehydrogenase
MAIRVGINGFGRTGRMFYRAAIQKPASFEIVAVNDVTGAENLSHLLKYDSVHGKFSEQVKVEGSHVMVNWHAFEALSEHDPARLPWSRLGVQLVVEASGRFTSRDKAAAHLSAGARKVVLSAPGEGADATFCMGVNERDYDPNKHEVVSNASCTTNCLAPIAKVLHENFGIVHGLMTTVHAYTNDQKLLDAPHKDPRRARAAAMSMIPTSTGAARAIGLVIPALKGKLDGIAVRVPTPNVSLVDLCALLERDADSKAINLAMKKSGGRRTEGNSRVLRGAAGVN